MKDRGFPDLRSELTVLHTEDPAEEETYGQADFGFTERQHRAIP